MQIIIYIKQNFQDTIKYVTKKKQSGIKSLTYIISI